MDVNNLGNTDLYLRLLFADPAGAPPTNEAFSTNAILLQAGSGWRSVVFPIDLGSLTADVGSVSGVLSSTTELRIFNSTPAIVGSPTPPPVAAQLGVDNIRATAIPEPATFALLGMGLTTIVAGAYRRKRS